MAIEEYEQKKIIAEIEHLKSLTKKIERDSAPVKASGYDKIKKISSLILTIVSVVAAIWGLLIPMKDYINERKSMLRYNLNNQMIELVMVMEDDSSDVTDIDRSILLLSYYERNSLPILFHKLERTKYGGNETLMDNIIQVIGNVYVDNKKETADFIYKRFEAEFNKFCIDVEKKIKNDELIDNNSIYTIDNLILVITQLPLNRKHAKVFMKLMSESEVKLSEVDSEKTLNSTYGKIADFISKYEENKL